MEEIHGGVMGRLVVQDIICRYPNGKAQVSLKEKFWTCVTDATTLTDEQVIREARRRYEGMLRHFEILNSNGNGTYKVVDNSALVFHVYCADNHKLKDGDEIVVHVQPSTVKGCKYDIQVEDVIFDAPSDFERTEFWD
jgi:hypothetical protein